MAFEIRHLSDILCQFWHKQNIEVSNLQYIFPKNKTFSDGTVYDINYLKFKFYLNKEKELIIMENIKKLNTPGKNESDINLELNEIIKKPFLTQKEIILNEVLDNIPEEDAKELIDGLKEETDEEEKDTKENETEVSRLNPETEIITEKDPDEIIILPNEELKKINNTKNKNHPL